MGCGLQHRDNTILRQ